MDEIIKSKKEIHKGGHHEPLVLAGLAIYNLFKKNKTKRKKKQKKNKRKKRTRKL